MEIRNYIQAAAEASLGLLPGGPAISALIRSPAVKEANQKLVQALEPVTQPIAEALKKGFDEGKKQLAMSKFDELLAKELEKENKEIAFVNKQIAQSTKKKTIRKKELDSTARIKQIRDRQNFEDFQKDRIRQDRHYAQRMQELREEARLAEQRRAEKVRESKPECDEKCDVISRLLRILAQYGIFMEKSYASMDPTQVLEAALAKAKHNVIGLMSFAREHSGLGLERFVANLAEKSIDSSFKELVASDVQLGQVHINDDILSPNGTALAQV